ncbi:dTMP kinase [Microaceticoccus formicicus]|uniref:dTMP kinase n=1 Tax=Microaceticoccus formicicus TaxID=3118105 RepID=UPI003CD01EF2|nr:dTMP kinase [Peptoniphilaceae bacterium AMB_02]
MRGKFIVFEGPDGCGKSTIAKNVSTILGEMGVAHILTREPGGTDIGEEIRGLLLGQTGNMSPRTEALLMAASRAQIVEEVIKTNLEEDKYVLCDRYVLSSLVYQGIGRKLGINNILEVNDFAMNGLLPDLTLYFDISFEEALKRRGKRDTKDRMENLEDDFHKSIHDGYEVIYKEFEKVYNIVKIDASKSEEEVTKDVIDIILNKWRGANETDNCNRAR